MYLVESISSSSHSIRLPSLPDMTTVSSHAKHFLNTASDGLDKVGKTAIKVFKDYAPAAAIALVAAGLCPMRTSAMAIAGVTVAVALLTMNFSKRFGAAESPQPAVLTKEVFHLDGSDGKWAIVKAVAITTLKELAMVAVVTTVTACFVASHVGLAFLAVGSIMSLCTNLFLRTVGAGVFWKYAELDPDTNVRTLPEGFAKKFVAFTEFAAPLSYGAVHFNTMDTVIHENGHALAVKALYTDAQTMVIINPYEGGQTGFFATTLSRFGNLFGLERAKTVIAAAGPAAAIGVATAEIVLADRIEKTHPRLSRYLKVMGGINIASHLFYACTTFLEASSAATASPRSGHDFVRLWAGGIHPYVSMVSMLALPLIVKTGIYLASQHATTQPAAALSTG